MRVNPIITRVNYYNSSKLIFGANTPNNNLGSDVSNTRVGQDLHVEDSCTVSDQNAVEKDSKTNNYYYNKDIVEEIGPDGESYFFLVDKKKSRVERLDSVKPSDPLGIYFEDVKKYDLLTDAEELELAQNLQNKDSKDRLIKSNLRYVITVANDYIGCGLPLADLIEEGNLGLIRAAQSFDYTQGVRFYRYADFWINAYIKNALREKSRMIRIPVSMQNRIKDIKKIIAELSRELNRAPTRQEIADRVGLPEDKVLTALQAVSKHVSIDEPVHSDDSRKVIDFIPSDLNFSSNELDDLSAKRLAVLEKVFSRLSDLEQNILNLRLGLKNNERPKSLREVAEIYGYSIRKVSNIEKNALMFLKAHCILIS